MKVKILWFLVVLFVFSCVVEKPKKKIIEEDLIPVPVEPTVSKKEVTNIVAVELEVVKKKSPSIRVVSYCDQFKIKWLVDFEIYSTGYHTNGYNIIKKIILKKGDFIFGTYDLSGVTSPEYINFIHRITPSPYLIRYTTLKDTKVYHPYDKEVRGIIRTAEDIINAYQFVGDPFPSWKDVVNSSIRQSGREFGLMKK